MFSAIFVLSVFVSVINGGISEDATSGSARAVTDDTITHLAELMQSVSPFTLSDNISRGFRQGQQAVVDETRSVCGIYTPCGWYTYDVQTRDLLEWNQSSCDCRNGTECVRVRDDISIASFEYRCRNVTSSATEA